MTGVEFVLGVVGVYIIRAVAEGVGALVAWAGERRTDRLAR